MSPINHSRPIQIRNDTSDLPICPCLYRCVACCISSEGHVPGHTEFRAQRIAHGTLRCDDLLGSLHSTYRQPGATMLEQQVNALR